jgi:hypothetical protein
MQKPLHQLRKVMLQLVVVVLVAVGIGLIVVGYGLDPAATPAGRWSAAFTAFGFAFFTAGGVTMIWEFYLRRVNEQAAERSLDAALRRAAPAFRDAFLSSLAFDAEMLKGIASDEHLDRIAANALALRLKDKQLANELYADVCDQVISAPERWHDVNTTVSLKPWTEGPDAGRGSMFEATIRWEYKTVPAGGAMRFACVSDKAEYRELLRDDATTSAWYHGQASGLDAADPNVFALLAFTVDGEERKIRRTARKGAQIYAVSLGGAGHGREVAVAYTYRALVQRHGHLLYLDLPRPTKGLRLQLDYAQAGIRRMNTVDYFASSHASRVEQARSSSDAKTVNISFDGWTLPRAGVAFVWVLEEELGAD